MPLWSWPQVVAERRKPAITAVAAAPVVPGTYVWHGGAPRSGQRCRLLYNTASGPLGAQGQTGQAGALLHLGYDGWWNQLTQVIEFTPLSPAEAKALSLPPAVAAAPSAATPTLAPAPSASWLSADVDVPASAAVLNWVVSDKAQRVWDNNAGRDFHTLVRAWAWLAPAA